MQVLLIKRDIRLEQNYAFIRACEGVKHHGKVICLFVHEPSLWGRPEYSRRHQNFVAECLASHAKRLVSCGGQLVEATGEIVEVLADLTDNYDIQRVVAHQEVTDSPGYERDQAIRAWADAKGVEFFEVEQNNVARSKGERLPFAQWFEAAAGAKTRNPVGKNLSDYLATNIQTQYSLVPKPIAAGDDCTNRQKGGREEAEKIMQSFFKPAKLLGYPSRVSSPITSVDGCSRLSPYLAWGVVSHAEVAKQLNDVVAEAALSHHLQLDRLENAARFYLDRLRWRMGYHAHCEVHPSTDTQEYFEAFERSKFIEALSEPEYRRRVKAMNEAQTGIPYIDACLRQLQATGYLGFRARSTTANFLCMGLGLHWRDVGEHLASIFLDFDGGAIHWSQMRIASGTGLVDTLLVYSVAKQARDFDKDCKWQKKWVPELKGLPTSLIHQIWAHPDAEFSKYSFEIGKDYPRAICNPDESTKVNKQRVYSIRRSTN